MEVVECAFFGIVRSQALAQAVGLHAHNRVGILVKGGRAMEDLDADGIFLEIGICLTQVTPRCSMRS